MPLISLKKRLQAKKIPKPPQIKKRKLLLQTQKPTQLLKMVIGKGMLLTTVAVGFGLVVAFGVTRAMTSLLFGVSAADPVTFIGVALLLTGVAMAACWLPARRATRVDPIVALRSE